MRKQQLLRVAPYNGAHAAEWQRFINQASAVDLPCGVTLHIPRVAYTLNAVLELVRSQLAHVGQPIRVVDLGAGTAQVDAVLLKELPRAIAEIIMVDRSESQRTGTHTVFGKAGIKSPRKGSRQPRWSYIVQDLSRPAPLPEADLVLSIHLLSEMPDYDLGAFFARVAAILPPGGKFFIETLHPDLIEAALSHYDRDAPLVVNRTEARARWPDRDITSTTAWVFYPNDGSPPFPTQNEVHPTKLLMRHASLVGLRLEREIGLPIHPQHARVNVQLARFREMVPAMRQMIFVKD